METTSPSAEREPWPEALKKHPWFWLGTVMLYFALDQGRQEDPLYLELSVRSLVWGLCGGVLSSWLAYGYARAKIHTWRVATISLVAVCGGLGMSVAWLILFNLLDDFWELEAGYVPMLSWDRKEFFGGWMEFFLVSLVWHGALGMQVQTSMVAITAERVLRAEKLAEEARVAMLRYQINPHFLFNSLNSAIALVEEDPEGAQEMLTHLSVMFRDKLSRGLRNMSTLREEMDVLRRYLAIEKVRFEDNLQVLEDVEEACMGVLLPSFVLQPLVENALKHGMKSSSMPLRVEIEARKTGEGTVQVVVKNTGVLGGGSGVGLENVKGRLAMAFGRSGQTFSLKQEGERVCACLEVPC